MKVLNLYAGIGGNRKLWKGVSVTAVEIDPALAAIYSKTFPEDKVIIADAHQYLLENHKEFDFIWASPPCQSHSSFRQNICVRFRGTAPVFPDMRLYQEILFLQHNASCCWVVENVRPYYRPLIEPDAVLNRHLFWSSFKIEQISIKAAAKIRFAQIAELEQALGFNLKGFALKNKRQVLRNCVDPKLGEYIMEEAKKQLRETIAVKKHTKNNLSI